MTNPVDALSQGLATLGRMLDAQQAAVTAEDLPLMLSLLDRSETLLADLARLQRTRPPAHGARPGDRAEALALYRRSVTLTRSLAAARDRVREALAVDHRFSGPHATPRAAMVDRTG